MKALVLGANGATGFNVVNQLLEQGIEVKALTRSVEKFDAVKNSENIEVIKAGILDIENKKLKNYLSDVDAVISCLGHNITLKGLFGKPRKLVVDALKRITETINEMNEDKTLKIILMNTTACLNKMQSEKFKMNENLVMGIMRLLLPPQRDNESALAHLIDTVGMRNKNIE